MPPAEQNELKAHFNGVVDSCDQLGDLLFGDVDDFASSIDEMDMEQKKAFVNELIRVELFDGDCM